MLTALIAAVVTNYLRSLSRTLELVIPMNRRSVLALLGGSATLGTAYAVQNDKIHLSEGNSVAVPGSYRRDEEFKTRLGWMFEGFAGFEPDHPNVLFDVISVGGHRIPEDVKEHLERTHEEHGIQGKIHRRSVDYPGERFLDRYGGDVGKILGTEDGYSGFVDDEVTEEMDEAAVQIILTPGAQQEREGWLQRDGEFLGGVAYESVILVSVEALRSHYDEQFKAGMYRTLLHEIGHVYGLEHAENPNSVMHEDVPIDSRLDLKPGQWKRIRERLAE